VSGRLAAGIVGALGAVLFLLVCAPDAAAACGISYQEGGGVPTPVGDCANGPAIGAAAAVLTTTVVAGGALAIVSVLRTGLSGSDLADALDAARQVGDTATRPAEAGGRADGPTSAMGRRRDWADPGARPRPPAREPDSYLAAGDPVYYRDGATAIGYDSRTLRVFDSAAPRPGYHDVVVHGLPNGLVVPGYVGSDGGDHPGSPTHPHQIAEAVGQNPHYRGGPVRLLICHSARVEPGAGVPPVAQQIADALGVTVVAPTDVVGVNRYGPRRQVPQVGNGGRWVSFQPREPGEESWPS